ncbi:MAG: molybdopterin-dependent oxidoreductase [Chromatiales bacterium]
MAMPGISEEAAEASVFEPNVFVRIDPDNRATITVSQSEMGQGVRTTLAMIVAEELDLDWSRVSVRTAPANEEKYGRQGTGGSASIRRNWTRLRESGASARAMLVAAAAERLGVAADTLETGDSHVIDPASGRRLAYGDLAAAAATKPVPDQPSLKTPAQFRLLGKEHPGVDVDAIVTGKAVYGADVRLPGMLYAVVERSPVHGGSLKSYDDTAALKINGVRKVVTVPAVGGSTNVHAGVAVIADSTWAAMQGRDALAIEWNAGPHGGENSAAHSQKMHELTSRPGEATVNRLGDPDKVLAAADDVLSATYEVPFLSHATMEPMNCTAAVDGDRCRIWAPTQFPNWAARATSEALKIPAANVSVEITLIGGGFGRRINPDYAVEAALVAAQADAPVKVTWSREDDMRHDFYRPAAVHVIDACLDESGMPLAWRQRFSTPAIRATYSDKIDVDAFGVGESDGAANMLYRIPNRSCEYSYLDSGINRGWWRAVHTTHATFAVESFIDELAERAGKDPLELRLALIDELEVDRPEQNEEFPFRPQRLKGVLQLAAAKAGWGRPLPAGHGMGIACGIDHLSYAAEVVEVSVIDGKLRIHKVVCAADCGPVLNPNGGRAQIEGGIVQGLSAALRERITVADGRIVEGNFGDYRILRINESPLVIETYFAETDAHPTGLGEPSVPPIAAALANAIYAATGKRHRSLPIEI